MCFYCLDVDTKSEHHERNPYFLGTIALFQLIAFIFFVTSADYPKHGEQETVSKYYGMYQDVHVMIFIGFGFLMTFLRKHMFNSLGMTFLIGVMAIQLSIMWNCVFHEAFHGNPVKLVMNIKTLICGDFAAGAVLISFGAVVGRVTPVQVLWMLFFELIFYALNEYIGVSIFHAVDMGGSMFVHTFGAYFGLAFSFVIGPPKNVKQAEDESSVYMSDVTAMIGTIFLWMYWPSFNGALAGQNTHQQERVVINTVLALCASCSWSFFFSHLYEGKLDMVHIQNATLAGGVAVGSSSDLIIGPFSALIIGLAAGFISTTGYVYLTPTLNRIGIYDVCGINNLHGMPGLLGGIAGAISAASATKDRYGETMSEVFEAMGPVGVEGGLGRTPSGQGAFQAAALGCTLLFAIVGGSVTGVIIKMFSKEKENLFSDYDEWEVPTEEFSGNVFQSEKQKLKTIEMGRV